jgi:hypothetical protein
VDEEEKMYMTRVVKEERQRCHKIAGRCQDFTMRGAKQIAIVHEYFFFSTCIEMCFVLY